MFEEEGGSAKDVVKLFLDLREMENLGKALQGDPVLRSAEGGDFVPKVVSTFLEQATKFRDDEARTHLQILKVGGRGVDCVPQLVGTGEVSLKLVPEAQALKCASAMQKELLQFLRNKNVPIPFIQYVHAGHELAAFLESEALRASSASVTLSVMVQTFVRMMPCFRQLQMRNLRHLDIKPENMAIHQSKRGGWKLWLLDFQAGGLLASDNVYATVAERLADSRNDLQAHMPPELAVLRVLESIVHELHRQPGKIQELREKCPTASSFTSSSSSLSFSDTMAAVASMELEGLKTADEVTNDLVGGLRGFFGSAGCVREALKAFTPQGRGEHLAQAVAALWWAQQEQCQALFLHWFQKLLHSKHMDKLEDAAQWLRGCQGQLLQGWDVYGLAATCLQSMLLLAASNRGDLRPEHFSFLGEVVATLGHTVLAASLVARQPNEALPKLRRALETVASGSKDPDTQRWLLAVLDKVKASPASPASPASLPSKLRAWRFQLPREGIIANIFEESAPERRRRLMDRK